MNQPALLILDEPTTGLDPASRAELWDDGIEVADIALRQPSLDEAFLALTAGTTMTGATAR